MKNAKKFGAFAAMAAAVVCAYSARALDLPGAGETYTVPSGVTNVITDAEIDAYNALGKVVFTDETSALRFTAGTAPNVLLEGSGWMIIDYAGDSKLIITQQQTTAWIGTWDIRDGYVGLGHASANMYSGFFRQGGNTGLHDLYVREGAHVGFENGTRCIHGLQDARIHLSGMVTVSPGGYSPLLRQIEVESDSAVLDFGGSVIPEFRDFTSGGVFYKSGINLNGHYLKVAGAGYGQSCLVFWNSASAITGPGAVYVNSSAGTGIRVHSSTSSSAIGSLDIFEGVAVTSNLEIGNYWPRPGDNFGKHGIVRQRAGSSFVMPSGMVHVRFGGEGGGRPAYLLEGGVLDSQNGILMQGGTNVEKAVYMHFRQTDGAFSASKLQITNLVAGLYADLAFGGVGTAKIGSGGLHVNGDVVFSFLDGMKFSLEDGVGVIGGHRIWAYNGGTAESRFLSTGGFSLPDGDFFAFNGGMIAYGYSSNGTTSDLFGSNPDVRIYERGGGIALNSGVELDVNGVDFLVPQGNVLKSIEMSDELRNKTWKTPPSVHITDSTGTGANAAAIVDYDFDSQKVTNITVVSGGENYSAPTANLRYKDGDALLTTPLTCNIGPEASGSFTFTTTNLGAQVWLQAHTNFTYGSIIVDMDPLGFVDGGFVDDSKYRYTSLNQNGFENTLVIKYYATNLPIPRFANCTNIVVKSGGMHLWSSWGYNHDYLLPNCYSLEIYGGHIGGGTLAVTNLVVGGTAFLSGHNYMRSWGVGNGSSPYSTDLNVYGGTPKNPNVWRTMYSVCSTPGTVTIDVDSPNGPAVLKGGCTPSIDANDDHSQFVGGGSFRFGGTPSNPSTLTIKNYESLKTAHGRRLLFDLSDPNLVVAGTNNVNTVTPPDIANFGKLKWSPVQRKLYWMPDGGMYLIFK